MSETKNQDQDNEKRKFVFNCTKCGNCCSTRGPVPLVMDDLVLWGKNNVVQNVLPYIKFIKTKFGSLDLVLARTDKDPYAFLNTKKDEKPEEPTDLSCPLFNKEKKECLIYINRPLSCRTYPLEYDGSRFVVVDAENCPGIGNGDMTKEERTEFREMSKRMNEKLKENVFQME